PGRARGPRGAGGARPGDGPDRAAALLRRADDGRDGRGPRAGGADPGPAVALPARLADEAPGGGAPTAEACPRPVAELFDRAIDLEPTRLAVFLDEQCGGDAELRAAVEELLRLDRRADATESILRSPVAESRLKAAAPAPPSVARYRLVRVLGE